MRSGKSAMIPRALSTSLSSETPRPIESTLNPQRSKSSRRCFIQNVCRLWSLLITSRWPRIQPRDYRYDQLQGSGIPLSSSMAGVCSARTTELLNGTDIPSSRVAWGFASPGPTAPRPRRGAAQLEGYAYLVSPQACSLWTAAGRRAWFCREVDLNTIAPTLANACRSSRSWVRFPNWQCRPALRI